MKPGVLLAKHRVNTVEGIASLPPDVSAEIDLRTRDRGIILSHDPFQDADLFEDWLKAYKKDRPAPILLNVKEDQLEETATALCEKYQLKNFFFLDCAFPTLRRLSEKGFTKLAIRVSEFENIEVARALQGKIEWAWVDCFTGRVPEKSLLTSLQEMGFRVALVSPELQGYGEEVIRRHFAALPHLRAEKDLVCTKRPDLWTAAFTQ
jgi:hypothetical protein